MRAGQLFLAALLCVCLLPAATLAGECRTDTVHLKGDWGVARFRVELADDAAERARGLMYREFLPLGGGMLFVYPRPYPASFWMRNTLIPLDIIFMDETGRVVHIHERAQPLDETPVSGGDNVLFVLEVNGGLSRQLGLTVGSVMRHPSVARSLAAWPC
ncbi:MAG: hypothetical protein CML69_10675 [Rhodobacteraceae bacterium]|nr:hypothetical protein [Paracoccaceae bacterium]